MNPERAAKTPRYPGVCASRLYFLLHFRNWSPESVHVCHAPVFDARGRQKCAAGHRPTVRRWVKNDGSGTLGFFSKTGKVQFGEIRIALFLKAMAMGDDRGDGSFMIVIGRGLRIGYLSRIAGIIA